MGDLARQEEWQGLVRAACSVCEGDVGLELTAGWVVNLSDWVQRTEENDRANDHEDDEDHESEADHNLLPLLDALSERSFNVVLVHALGHVHVGLYLSQFDPLKRIQRGVGECPIDQGSELENKRNGQVSSVDDSTDWVETVHQETAFSNLRESNSHLVGLQSEVDTQQDVERDDPSVVGESVAVVAGFSVRHRGPRRLINLVLALAVGHRRGQSEEDEVVRNEQDEPKPVELGHPSPVRLLVLRNQVLVQHKAIPLIFKLVV